MEYIDKTKSQEWAHTLIKEFLEEYLNEYGEYPENLYDALRKDHKHKDLLVNKLLEDNLCRCCYCMREIKGTTLEHMIPQCVKEHEEFMKYFDLESNLDDINIMLTKEFLENPKEVPPYPHTIAYENLMPSCFGNLPIGPAKCCNNYRGNQIIQPLVFRQNIHEEVKYKSNGSIEWTEDPEPIFPTVSKLGLDCLELRAIRRIWYYLATHNMGCEDTNKDRVIEDLLIELGKPRNAQENNMRNMLFNFKNLDYWKLLEKYSYFNNREVFE